MGDPRNAGLGSISWRASARSVLLVGQDSETGERAICQTKNNLSEQSPLSVGFEIVNGQFLFNSNPSGLTKERMLAQPKDADANAEQSEAEDFLLEALRTGEKSSRDVEKEAKELDITMYAFRKAKKRLGIKPFKKGGTFGGDTKWYMRLPGAADVVDIREFQHLQENHGNKASLDKGLTEDVDSAADEQVQHLNSTSSEMSAIKIEAPCDCGEIGIVGHWCRNCGESVQAEGSHRPN